MKNIMSSLQISRKYVMSKIIKNRSNGRQHCGNCVISYKQFFLFVASVANFLVTYVIS